MRRMKVIGIAALALAVGGASGCRKDEAATSEPTAPSGAVAKESGEPKAPAAPSAEVDRKRLAVFQSLPEVVASEANPVTDEKVALGKMLYFEERLSKNQDVSCNSCHALDEYGVDGEATSPGHKGQRGDRNSPTVYNAAGHALQFWDGRAKDVEEQALGPITNPVEMALASGDVAVAVLKSIPGYAEAFAKAFPGQEDPITFDNVGKAIGAFERKLVTPSRFDAFLAGQDDALTDDEKKGLNVFMDVGCTTCHMGAYVGGAMLQKLGLHQPWPNLKDEGRFAVTKNEAERFFFKVPSLRNIAKTGPYFHDGSVASLDEAVRLMAKHQTTRELSDEEVGLVVTFLNALTGDLPGAELIGEPTLPESGPETPKPDPT